jgi:hypothetical protein
MYTAELADVQPLAVGAETPVNGAYGYWHRNEDGLPKIVRE